MAGHAQQPAPQRAERTLSEGVTAVLVDVVVRDKRGQPVRDLTQRISRCSKTASRRRSARSRRSSKGTGRATPRRADPRRQRGRQAPRPRRARRPPMRTDRDGARVRSAEPGSAAARGAGRAELSRDQGRDAGLHRDLRRRSGAHALRAVHAQRARAAAGARRRWPAAASASFNSPEQQQQKASADQQAAAAGPAAAGAAAAGGRGAGGGRQRARRRAARRRCSRR